MWDVKTIIEVIKSIPVIKQIWGYLGSSQNIKIEVFPHKEFRKPFGTYWIDKEGIEHPQLPLELSHNKGGIAIAITNYGKEDIRLEQITLNVYVKKGFVCKTKVDEFKSEKFKDGLPSTIPPKGDKKLNTKTNLDKLERGKIIYEVIAEFNNRKTKHVHKVKA